jgi:hypothetical protein
MKIHDSILPDSDFKALEDRVMGGFPWYYGRKAQHNEEYINPFLYGWYHIVGGPRAWVDGDDGIFKTSVFTALEKAGEKVEEILRVRMILNTVADKSYLTGAHSDQSIEHKTALLYMNDSDGPTIIYKEKYVHGVKDPELFNILSKVEPKRNRLLVFDGLHYHAGTTPTKVARILIGCPIGQLIFDK